MTISEIPRRAGPYTGDGSTTTYPFSFVVFATTDVAVFVAGSESATATPTQLTLGTDYTVTLEEDGTGAVTLAEPLADGSVLAILSAIPQTQEMRLTNQGAFYPTVINDSADKLTALIQQVDEKVSRAVLVGSTSPSTPEEFVGELLEAKGVAQEYAEEAAASAETAQEAAQEAAQEVAQEVAEYADQAAASAEAAQEAAESAQFLTDVVHKAGAEEISGSKTFGNEMRTSRSGSASHIRFLNAGITKGVFPETQQNWYFPIDGDEVGMHFGAIETIARTNGEVLTRLYAFKNESGSNSNVASLSVVYPQEDPPYLSGQRTPANSVGSQIVTANYLREHGYATGRLASLAFAGSYVADLPGYLDGGLWSSAIQGMAYDKHSGILYTICNYGGQGTFICAFDWATKALLGTNYTEASGHNAFYGGWAHQSLAVYRPTAADPAGYFFAAANTYTAADTQDTSRAFTLNLNRWDYTNPGTYTTERSWTVFNPVTFDISGGSMNITLTEDGTRLCAKAKRRSDGVWIFYTWKVADILAADSSVVYLSTIAETEIVSPYGTSNVAGQAMAADATHLYCLYSNAGAAAHQIRVIDRTLRTGITRPGSYEGFELYGDTTTYAEAECLAFIDGHLMMGMQCIGTGDSEPRAIRIYDMQIGSGSVESGRPSLPGAIAIDGSYIGNEHSTNGRTTHVLRSNRDTKGQSCAYIYRFRNNSDQGAAQNNFLEIDLLENGTRYRGPMVNANFANGELNGFSFAPVAVNPCDLGASSAPWKNTYLSANPIVSSDERLKQNIEAIPEAVLRAWGDVEFVQFRYRDAVAKKGGEARLHTGVIAQRVRTAFEAHGIDPFAYGILCHDEWGDDPDLGQQAGDKYSVRYEEALILECAYQRWRLAQIEARLG